MNELIDRKCRISKGEQIGNTTLGIQNKLFTENEGIINIGYQNFENTYDLDKEIEDQEKYLRADLELGFDQYQSRLCFNSMHNSIELDLGSSNIIETYNLWDYGFKKNKIILDMVIIPYMIFILKLLQKLILLKKIYYLLLM